MHKRLAAIAALVFCLAAAPAMAQSQTQQKDFPVVMGFHWVNATPQERLAFVAGMATMLELEKEVQGSNPHPEQKSLVPDWIRGLSKLTFKEIVAALDSVFESKPELQQKPVVEVLWYEVAFPNLKK
jgi:hypothetical protein